jgi:hypothetical protein
MILLVFPDRYQTNMTLKKILIIVTICLLIAFSLILIFPDKNLDNKSKDTTENTPTPSKYKIPNNNPTLPITPGTAITGSDPVTMVDQREINNAVAQKIPDLLLTGSVTIKSYYVYQDWAVITVVATKINLDSANAILKKENDVWVLKYGPTTLFEEDQLKSAGVPEQITEKANHIPLWLH